jgi:hypothetical protein
MSAADRNAIIIASGIELKGPEKNNKQQTRRERRQHLHEYTLSRPTTESKSII